MMVSHGPTTQKNAVTMVVFDVMAHTINQGACKKQF